MDLALLPDGSVYVLGSDGAWHHIPDVATANAMGIDWNALPKYDQLPGPAGTDLASVATAAAPAPPTTTAPVATQPTPAGQSSNPNTANGPLALLPDGSLYMLGADQLWHHIPDVATANAMGVDWNSLPRYDELPGPVGDALPQIAVASPAPTSPPPSTATPAGTQPTPIGAPSASYGPSQLVLLPDGSIYALGSDGAWHHIPDVATANAMAIDWNSLPKSAIVPGPLGSELPSVIGVLPGGQRPPASLSGQSPAQPRGTQSTHGGGSPGSMNPTQPSPGGTAVQSASSSPQSTPPPVTATATSTPDKDEARALLSASQPVTIGNDDSSNWSLRVRQLYGFQYLKYNTKLSDSQVAAVLGNLMEESGMNPRQDGGYIAQWGGSRLGGLLAFAQTYGGILSDQTPQFSTQIQYVVYELTHSESQAYTEILATNNVTDATAAVMNFYERPRRDVEHFDRRLQAAQQILMLHNSGDF